MAELSKAGKTYISGMLDRIMFARRGEEITRGVDVKEIDKFIQDESVRLMEKYGKMEALELAIHALTRRAKADEAMQKMLKEKENAPLD